MWGAGHYPLRLGSSPSALHLWVHERPGSGQAFTMGDSAHTHPRPLGDRFHELGLPSAQRPRGPPPGAYSPKLPRVLSHPEAPWRPGGCCARALAEPAVPPHPVLGRLAVWMESGC